VPGGLRPYGDLAALFAPASIAVVGASADPSKFGGRVFHYLHDGGFRGRVHAVNSREPMVQGVRTAPSVTAIDDDIDLAVLAVPAAACESVVRECTQRGVRAAIVFTSGFAESGAQGAARQRSLLAAATSGNLRLLGPNCIGVANERAQMAATFATMWLDGWSRPGAVSIVSQSGALASYFYVQLQERGVGIATWCSTGNEIDIDVAECIHYLAADDATRVIVAAIEGVRDGRRLLEALDAARRARKPVLLLKIGRSQVGTAAAVSHTGTLAGDDRVFDAAVEQSGALRCRDFSHAVDVAVACSLGRLPAGRRIGIVSASGGGGIMAADRAEECGLEVPELDRATRQRLDAMIPAGASRNPVDVTAMVLSDIDLMVKPIAAVAHANVDGVVVFLTSAFRNDSAASALRERLCAALPNADVPILLSGLCSGESRRRLLAAGFALYAEPGVAVEVLAALARFREIWNRDAPTLAALPAIATPAAYDEASLLAFLGRHGVPVADTRLVHSPEEAVAAAAAIGGTVVLKLAVANLAHKSELGGVIAGLTNAAEVRAAFATIAKRAQSVGLAGRLQGIVVQRQAQGVAEMLLGMRRDDAFGAVVTLGFGGKWVEVIDDIVIRVAPVTADEANRMIDALRGARLLRGVRDQPPADVDTLAAAIAAFSRVAASLDGVATLEVNPFVVGRAGEGGWAVDAKLVASR